MDYLAMDKNDPCYDADAARGMLLVKQAHRINELEAMANKGLDWQLELKRAEQQNTILKEQLANEKERNKRLEIEENKMCHRFIGKLGQWSRLRSVVEKYAAGEQGPEPARKAIKEDDKVLEDKIY